MNNTVALGSSPFTPASATLTGTDGAPAKTGQLRGEMVTAFKDRSILGDAAEEITMHSLLSEKAMELDSDEREVTTPTHARVMQIEEIKQYLETGKALKDPQELVKLAQRMMAPDSPGPLLLARQAFRESESNQYMALEFGLQYARSQNAPLAVQERIQDAIDLLCGDPDVKRRIHAGVNAVDAAASPQAGVEQTAADIARFQRDYADIAAGGRSIQQTFAVIAEQAGGDIKKFNAVVDRHMKALGADMAALRLPASSIHLEVVNKGLNTLKHYNTQCEALKGVLIPFEPDSKPTIEYGHQRAAMIDTPKPKGSKTFELMKELIMLSGEKWVSASRFTGMADRWELQDPTLRVTFISGIKEIIRAMPVQLFEDADVRQSILNAAQEALDAAIDEEELMKED